MAPVYELTAWYPNSTVSPLTEHLHTLKSAIDRALELRATLHHAVICVRTPDSMELIRVWGQPMLDGKDWP